MSVYRVLLLSVILSITVAGCASLNAFKERIVKASTQQIEPVQHITPPSPKKVDEQKQQQRSQVPSHNCNYIIRDLSIPNASAVWCVPKVQRK